MPLRVPSLNTIGVDIVKISRLAKYAATDDSPETQRFMRKFMTPRETSAFLGAEVGEGKRVQFLASRWAAKEAVIKAVQTRKLFLKDVEIYNRPSGPPFAVVLDQLEWRTRDPASNSKSGALPRADRGPVSTGVEAGELVHEHFHAERGTGKEVWRREGPALVADPEEVEGDLHGTVVNVSISHEGEYAVAMAVAPIGI